MSTKPFTPKPPWLKAVPLGSGTHDHVFQILRELKLHTVCEEAACPNIGECFGRRTATFMIMGMSCTRNCAFCNVTKGRPAHLDAEEPQRIAKAVRALGLRHVVITSVTRDDLPDGGAAHFASVIGAIRQSYVDRGERPPVVEVLVPDFKGDRNALDLVLKAAPEIFGHNIETVKRLYPSVRGMADYDRSLEVLRYVKNYSGVYSKSGIMVGLGETRDEIERTMRDLRAAHCDILTIGQYLAPSKLHHPVAEYIHPDTFEEYKHLALKLGFRSVASGPFVRSSYMSEEFNRNLTLRNT